MSLLFAFAFFPRMRKEFFPEAIQHVYHGTEQMPRGAVGLVSVCQKESIYCYAASEVPIEDENFSNQGFSVPFTAVQSLEGWEIFLSNDHFYGWS